MGVAVKAPERRQITCWEEAEINARDWMRAWGFRDAELTPPGACPRICCAAHILRARPGATGVSPHDRIPRTPDEYRQLQAAVAERLKAHDLLGVRGLGAIEDEYGSEIEEFAALIAAGETITPEVVAAVCHKSFGDPSVEAAPPDANMEALAADLQRLRGSSRWSGWSKLSGSTGPPGCARLAQAVIPSLPGWRQTCTETYRQLEGEPTMTASSVIVFAVNETLSDMSPGADRFREVGAPAELARL
jgi:hypothetical protein